MEERICGIEYIFHGKITWMWMALKVFVYFGAKKEERKKAKTNNNTKILWRGGRKVRDAGEGTRDMTHKHTTKFNGCPTINHAM